MKLGNFKTKYIIFIYLLLSLYVRQIAGKSELFLPIPKSKHSRGALANKQTKRGCSFTVVIPAFLLNKDGCSNGYFRFMPARPP